MKTAKMFLVMIFVVLSQTVLSQSCPDLGDYLASYKGVVAHSNGDDYNNTGHQCVDYVHQFYDEIYDFGYYFQGVDAGDFHTVAPNYGFIAYNNGGTVTPEPDMILCYSGGTGDYGHVAIITEVGSNYIKIIEENYLCNQAERTITMTVSSGHYTVSAMSGYTLQGWLKLGVGLNSDGTYCQEIIDKYNSERTGNPSYCFLGSPYDNGPYDEYVHTQNGVTLQDFFGDNTGFYHGHTAILLDDDEDEAHLLKEGFWVKYMEGDGLTYLGAPTSDEYDDNGITKQDFEYGHLEWDGTRIAAIDEYEVEMACGRFTPQNFQAVAVSSSQINLTWDDIYNYSGTEYIIYRSSVAIDTVATKYYQDTGLTNNTEYTYQVSAFYNSSESAKTDAASATTGSVSQPTNFPLTIEAEDMDGSGDFYADSARIYTTDHWFIYEYFNASDTGWVQFEMIAKADSQVNGEWPKVLIKYVDDDPQYKTINSTDYDHYFFYRHFTSTNASAPLEINVAQDQRLIAGYSVRIDKVILKYVSGPADPVLNLNTTSLNLGADSSGTLNGTLTVTNIGTGTLTGSVSVGGLFAVDSTSFSLGPDYSQNFNVSLNLAGLSAGRYADTLVVTSNTDTVSIGVEGVKYTSQDVQTLIVYAGSGDGRVQSYSDVSWENARNGTDNVAFRYTNATEYLNSDKESGRYYVTRFFFPFNTSPLPDTASIVSAEFVFTAWDTPYGTSGHHVRLVKTWPASTSQLASSDFDSVGIDAGMDSDLTMSQMTANDSVECTLNAAGRGWISKTGWTKLGVRVVESDINNTAPNSDNYMGAYFSEETGNGKDPHLIIKYILFESSTPPDSSSSDTTITVRYYTEIGDGRVQSQASSWSSCYAGTGTTVAEYTQASRYINSDHESGTYFITRVFYPFDTSDLPDGASITSAKFVFYEWDSPYIQTNQSIRLIQTSQTNPTSLGTSDFNLVGSIAGSGDISLSNVSQNSPVEFTLNTTGMSWIDKTGNTLLGLRIVESDINNTAPPVYTDTYIGTYFSEETGSDKDPYLEITFTTSLAKGLVRPEEKMPISFGLTQNYPNPFNPLTKIEYVLAEDSHVKLSIFNMLGQQVAVLVDEQQPSGKYAVNWNPGNQASGVYFYRIETPKFFSIKKMLFIK